MDLPAHLVPVFWTALAILGVSTIVFFSCLNVLADGHRRLALRAVWIAGSLMCASLIIVLMLLIYSR